MRSLQKFPEILCGKAVAVFFAAMLMSSVCLWQGNIAEAGANIRWQTTSVSLVPGKAIVRGYFYNNGNSGAYVNQMKIWGSIDSFRINVTYSGSNISVGYLGAGTRVDWTFTILERAINYSSSSPRYNFDWNVTFK